MSSLAPHPLTRVAFWLACVLAVGRALANLYLRDVEPVAPLGPGGVAPPRYAGPGVGVLLDAACLVPALLVLLRRAIDPAFPLPPMLGVGLMFATAAWAFLSFSWAGDEFAAAVNGSTWVAAAALLFAIAGSASSWADARTGLGLAAGVLVANVLAGAYFLLVDHPDVVARFEENLDANLAARGLEVGSAGAEQFVGRLRRGEFTGTTNSVNSYAATLGGLSLVAAGLAWSSLRAKCPPWSHFALVAGLVAAGTVVGVVADSAGGATWPLVGLGVALAAAGAIAAMLRDPTRLATLLAVPLPAAAMLLVRTGGRTAIAAVLLAGAATIALWPIRAKIARRRSFGTAVVGFVLLGFALLLGYGLASGWLPHVSLRFRLAYWQGALAAFADRPVLGVGFANFGDAYLLHRPPGAAEEPGDPHNLPIRFLVETGVVGLLLALAWLLATGRDLAASATAATVSNVRSAGGTAWMALGGVAIATLATLDTSADPGYVVLELLKAAVVGLAVTACVILATARTVDAGDVDESPAPAMVAAALAGLAAWLVHAMLDVVVFSPSLLFVAVLVAGAILGTRERRESPRRRGVAWTATAGGIVTFPVIIVMFSIPTSLAEASSAAGDKLVREGRPGEAVGHYVDAFERSPATNAHYLDAAARAAVYAGEDARAVELLEQAEQVEPTRAAYAVALSELASRRGDAETAVAALERAVVLSPTQVSLRLRLADAYERAARPAKAAEQIEAALELDDAFAADEPERLSPERVAELRARAATLRAS